MALENSCIKMQSLNEYNKRNKETKTYQFSLYLLCLASRKHDQTAVKNHTLYHLVPYFALYFCTQLIQNPQFNPEYSGGDNML